MKADVLPLPSTAAALRRLGTVLYLVNTLVLALMVRASTNEPASPEGVRAGKLSYPLIGQNSYQSMPCTLTGHRSGDGSGLGVGASLKDMRVGELTLLSYGGYIG